jgi:hypothetical protein
MFARLAAASVACLALAACAQAPSRPSATALRAGRWTGGNGVCLSVGSDTCDLVIGCGHGAFPPPAINADGTFQVNGTYRVEVGPISINPAPPAVFSGLVSGETLTITVNPSDPSLKPASYMLQWTADSGRCAVPCV